MHKFFFFLLCSPALFAHPMGNFSVSHFSKLQPTTQGVELQYVLDLAEIPTFELLRTWNIDRQASPKELHTRAVQQAREWVRNLKVTEAGRAVPVRLQAVKATMADGAGNLPILRIEMSAHLDAEAGALNYEDQNYPERAGWKEIVVVPGNGGSLISASQSDKDLSHALTQYPADPTVAPPQDLRTEIRWAKTTPIIATAHSTPPATPVIAPIVQPHQAPAAASPVTMTPAGAPSGSLIRGDFLSRLLHRRELPFSMILVALVAAFGLGAAHALTPGHGKTIVAAYLVGSRGALKHAAFLGAMVTFTHTISVFALGLATLFLFRFIVPEKITIVLGALSGLSIVCIGAFMLYKRVRHGVHAHEHSHLAAHAHSHSHNHDHGPVYAHAHPHHHEHAHVHTHDHELEHAHAHQHAHAHAQAHSHDHEQPHVHPHTHDHEHSHGHSHSHGLFTHTHSHVPELSWAGLVALGASGGLVPCESALLLLLGAIALGRVGLGLLLLVSFSLGLATLLMLIGVVVIYAKNLLPERSRSQSNPFFRWVSIASPAVVIVVGTLMTAASLGWIQSKWMVG